MHLGVAAHIRHQPDNKWRVLDQHTLRMKMQDEPIALREERKERTLCKSCFSERDTVVGFRISGFPPSSANSK